jgi:phage shock protein A
MPDGYNVDELRAAAVASQEKVDQMVGGGGPASDAEAFVFDAEMIHIFAEQLVYVTEVLEQLTRRIESLEKQARSATAPS